ncbi:MAG TPA: TVP38/TMEM64 family protein [Kofleriaceae bacterium]|nr:TVP38/TMEM64 family protein [Kofleriaceae bacterium]
MRWREEPRNLQRRALTWLAVALSLVVLVALWRVLPVATWVAQLAQWIRDRGVLGVLAFAVIYVAAAAVLFPASLLTLAAGFAYGVGWGTLLISPVSVVAATLSFVIARYVARDAVNARIASDARFVAIDHAVAQDGFKTVMLLRLSPLLPFSLLNYGLGLSRVRLRDFVVGSFVGMLPGTVLYVYVGSLFVNVSELSNGSPTLGGSGRWFYWVGLVATLLVTWLVTRAARAALRAELVI